MASTGPLHSLGGSEDNLGMISGSFIFGNLKTTCHQTVLIGQLFLVLRSTEVPVFAIFLLNGSQSQSLKSIPKIGIKVLSSVSKDTDIVGRHFCKREHARIQAPFFFILFYVYQINIKNDYFWALMMSIYIWFPASA